MTASFANALTRYIAAPDASYALSRRGESVRSGVTITDLHLVSQTWRGIRWEHHLQLFRPTVVTVPDTVLLYNTGLDAAEGETLAGMALAQASGMICAILYHVPNQPLFGGLMEDALIAHTLSAYLESGDDDWPLLLPMTKCVVRAMDALQEFLPQATGGEVAPNRFIISGASKRGWNSWLVAAVESASGGTGRVAAILPMVYDNLNLMAQMPHQVEVWGTYSDSIGDYTDLDLQAQMPDERGQALAALIDPYAYRDVLALPKLLINGTNDSYWATDALNLYWEGLIGPKNVLYVPNAGHSLRDTERVFRTSAAFLRTIGSHGNLPQLEATFDTAGDFLHLTLHADALPHSAQIWTAQATTQDFRGAYWQPLPMSAPIEATRDTAGVANLPARFVGQTPRPSGGFTALFAEAEFTAGVDLTYTLSTPLAIVRA